MLFVLNSPRNSTFYPFIVTCTGVNSDSAEDVAPKIYFIDLCEVLVLPASCPEI